MKTVISGCWRVACERSQLAAKALFRILITACQPLKAVASDLWRVASKAPSGPQWKGNLYCAQYFTSQSTDDPTRIVTPATHHYPLATEVKPQRGTHSSLATVVRPLATASSASGRSGEARRGRCSRSLGTRHKTQATAFFLFLFFFGFARNSFAQSETASISGRVTDPKGGVIPKTVLEAIQEDTNVKVTTETNGDGLYYFPSLHPTSYRLVVSRDGFKQVVQADIVLHVQDSITLNFALQLGSVSETVTVNANDLNINTIDGSVSTVIDRKFVENIPLNGRSFQDLITLTPGVVTQSPQANSYTGDNGDFSINGQRTESNYYTVDGVSANIGAGTGVGQPGPATGGSIAASTALGTTQSLVSVDALQELRIQSSTYSAEYGHGPGGQFSFVTRSGTNDFHGTAFDYLRNDVFDANDRFNDSLGVPKSALRQNDFGGTLGGPVLIPGLYDGKDKTFFFVSYEGLRLDQPQPAASNIFVPDTFMREQAPAALQPILNAFPLQSPNGTDHGTAAAPSLAQFIGAYSLPSEIDSTSIRVDQTFSPKLSLFFRFGDTPSSTETRNLSVVSQSSFNTRTYTLGVSSQFSSKANNEFRIGYAQTESSSVSTLDGFGGATPINLAAAVGVGSENNALPVFDLQFGPGFSAINTSSSNSEGRQWNVIDTFSFSSGHHLFKFGMDYRRIKSPLHPSSPVGELVFSSVPSVLSNSADLAVVQQQLSSVPLYNETAAFFQDDWRVTSTVNLSLGLRWEVDPPPTGADGRDAYTLLGSFSAPSTLMLAPASTPLWKTSWYNFAPRLGVAWQAQNHPGWETVIRTGGGVFFDTNSKVAAGGFFGIGFQAIGTYFGVPVPLTTAQVNISPSTTPPFPSTTAYIFPPHLQLPYTLQWNTSIEQAMGKSQALTLSYVGAAGRRLMQDQTTNTGPNPNFPNVEFYPSGVTSNYQALQIEFQRQMSHGLQALASYTWSHSIDYGSADAANPLTRGNSDFDVRHNFSGGVTWDLPSVPGNRVIGDLLDHWGVDSRLEARTGFPITIQGNFLVNPADGSSYYGNPDLVPGQPIYLYGSQYPGGRAVNPGAFAFPANPSDPGNAPRNFVRGFGAWQINLAVRREFPIHDKLRLQFRAEAFNVLNHPNFGYVDPNLGDVTFGQATSMLNQSLATLASQYQQGGPRSMQFALRLSF
jgi:hypothetical protein